MVPLPLLQLVPLPAGSMPLVPLPAAPLVIGARASGALGKQLLREKQWQAGIEGVRTRNARLPQQLSL